MNRINKQSQILYQRKLYFYSLTSNVSNFHQFHQFKAFHSKSRLLNKPSNTTEYQTQNNNENQTQNNNNIHNSNTIPSPSHEEPSMNPHAFVFPGSSAKSKFSRIRVEPGEQLPIDPGALHNEEIARSQKYRIKLNNTPVIDDFTQGVIESRGLDRCPSPYAPGTNPHDNLPPPAQPVYIEHDSTIEPESYPKKPYSIYSELFEDGTPRTGSYQPPELSTVGRRFYNIFTYGFTAVISLYFLLEHNEEERERNNVQDAGTEIRKKWKNFKKSTKESFSGLFTNKA